MSHEIDNSTGRDAFAFVGKAGWHGLGQRIAPLHKGATEEERAAWHAQFRDESQLAWLAKLSQVAYKAILAGQVSPVVREAQDYRIVYRDDTGAALGVVSPDFRIVQPREAVEFFGNVSDDMGWTLETAGALKGGRVVFGLARMNQHFELPGTGDATERFALFSTGFDGTRATTIRETAIRVVCANTLAMAEAGSKAGMVSIHHRRNFDRDAAARAFAGESAWTSYIATANAAALTAMDDAAAVDFFLRAFDYPTMPELEALPDDDKVRNSARLFLNRIAPVYENAVGQSAINGTVWGALNAVTYYVDHEAPARSSNQDTGDRNRAYSALFGTGSGIKLRALDMTRQLVAA